MTYEECRRHALRLYVDAAEADGHRAVLSWLSGGDRSWRAALGVSLATAGCAVAVVAGQRPPVPLNPFWFAGPIR